MTRPRDLRRGRAAPICGGRAPSGGQTGRTTRLGSSEFCFKLRDLWCHLGFEKMGTALCCKHQMLYRCTYKGRHSESSVRTDPRGFSALFSSLSRERLIAPRSRLASLFSPAQKRCTGNKCAGFYLTAPYTERGENIFKLKIHRPLAVVIFKYQIFPSKYQHGSCQTTMSQRCLSRLTQISCGHYRALEVSDEVIRPTPCQLSGSLQNR